MTTDYIYHIIHATITNLDIIAIEDLAMFMISVKMFIFNKCKNCVSILVLTFLLNGGLYQMIFAPLFLLSCVYRSFPNMSFSEYPHLSKMSL